MFIPDKLSWKIVLLAGLMAACVPVKIMINGYSELDQARERIAAGDRVQSAVHFDRAIRWYLPGGGWRTPASQGLWELAETYENEKTIQQALNLYRTLRSAQFAGRSFYTPGQDWIERCNVKIASLMAQLPPETPEQRTLTRDQRYERALSVLQADRSPRTGFAFMAVLGFLGWVGSTLGFIFRACTPEGSLKSKPACLWGGSFLFFYGLWLAGMNWT